MWNESGSSVDDFTRIVALTRSQCVHVSLPLLHDSPFYRVGVALRRENVRPWHEVEQDFLESDYQAVRERQMKELEEEDDLLSKVPVRLVDVCRCWRPITDHFIEICARNSTRSPTNSSDNSGSTALHKALGSRTPFH